MKVIAVNGSPRKNWNTAMLLEKALEGAAAAGMRTELVHIYDLDFKGCSSCFACKLSNGPSYGRCAMRDGLTPLLEAAHAADALLLGSPVYFFDASGEMRSFMERLWFQYTRYSSPVSSLFPRRIRTALIYTMNMPEDSVEPLGLDLIFKVGGWMMETVFGHCETLLSTDTLQFGDHAVYDAPLFNHAAKNRRREKVFPQDMERAYQLGLSLAAPVPPPW